MPTSEPAPVACSLDGSQLGDRLAEFKALFSTALLDSRREDDQLLLDLDPRVEQSARDLMRREKECCAFWSFEFVAADDRLQVRMGVLNPDAVPLLDEFAQFAASSRGPTPTC